MFNRFMPFRCEQALCLNLKKEGSRYCHLHHTCTYTNCRARCTDDDTDCCNQHKCALPNCNKVKASYKDYCLDHCCSYPECIQIGVIGACSMHKCPDCTRVIQYGFYKCTGHIKCSMNDCHKPKVHTSGALYCSDHASPEKRCSTLGCNNSKILYKTYCSDHIIFRKPWQGDESNDHACVYTDCRASRTDDDTDCCNDHKCIEPNCNTVKAYNKAHCFDHTCWSDGCVEVGENGVCKDHKKKLPNNNPVKKNTSSLYCFHE